MKYMRHLCVLLLLATMVVVALNGQGASSDASLEMQSLQPWRAGEIVSARELAAGVAESGFSLSRLPDDVFARMQGKSYPRGCSVGRDELRYLQVLHYDFDGKVRRGELVCNRAIAQELLGIFKTLYEKKYPIHSIRLIDDFGADDEASMRANNTSCFCFRAVVGSKKLSKHSRGLAIDINPLLNPCVRKNGKGQTVVQPSTAKKYTDRSRSFRGKIDTTDVCYRLFREAGFAWGGNWHSLKDYQHFEK